MTTVKPSLWAFGFFLLMGMLSGCVGLADSEATRLCRLLIPALDAEAASVEISSTHETKTTLAGAFAVALDYIPKLKALSATDEPRRIVCEFAMRDWATPQAGIDALTAVASDVSGPLGPIRLRILKTYWIERGESAASDPAPFSTFGTLPRVSHPFAVGIQTALNALPLISIYALLAASYALVYGLLGRMNLAVGELTMLAGYGAFLGSALTLGTTPSLIAATAMALFTAIVQGAALGRLIIAPLLRAPGQHVLIATLGLSIVWAETVRLAQGNGNRWMPPILNRPWAFADGGDMIVTATPMALIVAAIAVIAASTLIIAMQYARFGRMWRALADDPAATILMGLDPSRIVLKTMIVAAAMTGLAGLLTTLYYGGVGFSSGLSTGLKALVGAILGGLATPRTAMLGGLTLGIAETMWSAAFPIEHRDLAIYIALIAIIVLRPNGLYSSAATITPAAERQQLQTPPSGAPTPFQARSPRSSH